MTTAPVGGLPQGPYVGAEALRVLLQGAPAGTNAWQEGTSAWLPLAEALAAEEARARPAAVEIAAATTEGAAGAVDEADEPEETSFEDDDGTMYDWDKAERRWVPREGGVAAASAPAGGGLEQQQQQPYAQEDMVFEPDIEPVPLPPPQMESDEEIEGGGGKGKGKGRKRKAEGRAEGAVEREKVRLAAARAKQEERAKERSAAAATKGKGTSVYFEGMGCDDATEAEIAAHFSKCGVIKPEPETGRPRVRLYRDDTRGGMLKGDGIVTYLKRASVELALQLLDGAPLRPGGAPMRVSEAVFEPREGKDKDKKAESEKQDKAKRKAAAGEGDGDASLAAAAAAAAARPLTKKERKKQQAILAKIEESKLGWEAADDVASRYEGTVVLRGVFSLEEAYDGGKAFEQELEEEIGAECGKLGAVKKVRVYPRSMDQVVTVAFANVEPAQACVQLMHGRYFGGQRIRAEIWDGFDTFGVAKEQLDAIEAKRLEEFGRHLDGE